MNYKGAFAVATDCNIKSIAKLELPLGTTTYFYCATPPNVYAEIVVFIA
nr:hypothetical protein [Pedobacter schmidteae]